MIQTYEKENFGEVFTDLSSSEAVVNMVAYIIGEEFLHNIYTVSWILILTIL